MKVAIDISSIKKDNLLKHRVRGIGFYIENLRQALEKYFPHNEYVFLSSQNKMPRKVDIIHYPYFEPFFLSLPFSKSSKTVITVHDLIPLVFPSHFPVGIRGKIKWNIQKFMLKKVAAIITDSISSKKDIIRFSGIDEKRINVVYLAAGIEYKKKILTKERILELQKKYYLPEDFLLYVGDATWNKNRPRLIKTAEAAGVSLVLVGNVFTSEVKDKENPWNKDLREVIRITKENKNIVKTGFVPEEDLVDLYNIAKVFIMPSLYEGFGLPVLEAMASGCPVITTKQGSLLEIAGESAYFIDPWSISSITQGIRTVWEDERLRVELSKKGLEQVKKFTWKKTAWETNQIYEDVANE